MPGRNKNDGVQSVMMYWTPMDLHKNHRAGSLRKNKLCDDGFSYKLSSARGGGE